MRVSIIANPVAGGGKGRPRAEELRRLLDGRVDSIDLILTQKPGDARDAAARSQADCVVAVGGDGSVNEIVNGMDHAGAALAILPVGTANVVARELRLPKHPEAAARMILDGRTRLIDAGRCNGRLFLLGAGAGLDAAVVAAVNAARGPRSGLLKWVRPAVRTCLTYPFPPIRAIVDGSVLSQEARYAIAANCRYSAGVFPATPKAKIDDGLLDVCLLHRLTPLKLAALAVLVWTEGFIRRHDVVYAQGRRIRLEPASDELVPLQIDGDPAGGLPAEIEIAPNTLRVFTPE